MRRLSGRGIAALLDCLRVQFHLRIQQFVSDHHRDDDDVVSRIRGNRVDLRDHAGCLHVDGGQQRRLPDCDGGRVRRGHRHRLVRGHRQYRSGANRDADDHRHGDPDHAGGAVVAPGASSIEANAEGGKAGVGPNLYGVVGHDRASIAGFAYSNGLKAKAGAWTFEDLNIWLKKPTVFAAGTKMAFAGINSDKQRADVIAYLRGLSKSPVALP